MDEADLVKEVRTVLKTVKIRQAQLALELGITQGRVSQILRKSRTKPISDLMVVRLRNWLNKFQLAREVSAKIRSEFRKLGTGEGNCQHGYVTKTI